MALFDPCMEFENFLGQMTSFEVLLKCHSLTLSKKCIRLHPAPSKCLSERINKIISIIPHRISKILFALGADELLAMLEGKIRVTPFFKVQSGKITVRIGITDNKTTTKIRLFRLRTLSRETALNSLYVKSALSSV